MGQFIPDYHRLAEILSTLRGEGKTLVTTNGVFDILHIGHVRYLQAAKQLGDLLVVGVNTDAGTKRLKGPDRPIVPQEERAEILAALACVDYVTLFDEPTPEALLEQLRPDIHVKGGDYRLETIPEAVVVHRFGGKVLTIPLVAEHSTTDIVKKIQRSLLRG
ncbi:D-glycero-beta-D-manno-heptose 1-phosphate adenylyltransferase [Chthonomonas calidirosea]|uniref:D-glycero-beta-D-manno-heptose 1-phosphate adenylyltransferase n=1 Tax=Chthonomonas calidirosea TaxID=454171 RepID=UPI0006ECA442|nr:D-glycero-beta-D-manno-heptose 1-phosphate adenylyltransferase [Chthonomonas calidirosea]CEK14868.1 D-heptose-1-phosphate adenylyltransferase [Chthonomonas calidirosea]